MVEKLAYLSLGSNIGDRQGNLERAVSALERERIRVTAKSSIYETEPQDVTDQPWFLNMVVACEMSYFPLQLLAVLRSIERAMGRVKSGVTRRGPRLIDIDILLFGNLTMETVQLTIPHPRMLGRRFVLEPLLEINKGLRYPVGNGLIIAHLKQLAGQTVRNYRARAQPVDFAFGKMEAD
ncbi:MAG: 2-amino-4-hydroxy-6-hydroxymethyldihydropteridine diphosphokinase [Acidobacteriota bacterium]|nr:2-amino-4-hydroxy-6-hydroxymethyldihydropteridine diphosphokinase [Acidobacteriota bacterium]